MSKKNNAINQILAHLANAAAAAADGVTDAVQSAGQVVGEKYDSVKLRIELSRLQSEQKKLFADIGRTMYLIQSGELAADEKTEEGEIIDAQQTVDRFLLLADQKQQDIDLVADRLSKVSGDKVCTVCGNISDAKDVFCPACGAKLPSEE